MNPDLVKLQPYPFEKLSRLKAHINPPAHLDHIALSIGEPKHPTPAFITEAVLAHLHNLAHYPTTRGLAALRQAIAAWLTQRFDLPVSSVDPERQILPVNGSREALFAFAQAAITRQHAPLVLIPNPFYQIYEGATLLAGAEPYYLPCTADTGFLPDFDAVKPDTWQRCQLVYICSPGNPTGAVLGKSTLQALITLAQEHDFIIAADECYSEIYYDETSPPVGLLQAAADMGHHSYRKCVVFNSLSKRSNAPGLRSGFIAGDANIIERFFLYRTYHGCAMPLQHQQASILAWSNEEHVKANRLQYREKLTAVRAILEDLLPVGHPTAGFYLWPRTPIPDTDFARGLFAQQHVTVLPGRYLSRNVAGKDPGINRVRMALVSPLDECVDGAGRICDYLRSL